MKANRSNSAAAADPAVKVELDRLPTMPIVDLRNRYRELFRAEPPKAFGPDLLRRSISQHIQEKAYGGLPVSTRRLLDQLVKAALAKPNGRLQLPKRIKPGSILVREWNGRSYRVMVQADGFAYDGETFGNLSEIAGLITGTRWNGPRFFGLRSKAQNDVSPIGPSRHGGAEETRKFGGGRDYRKRNADRLRKAARGGQHHGL